MRENIDQAAIDEILASAEADTPESRLEKIEKELDILKGSIKKLLLDLRETLNNIENPFQNLQDLAEGALSITHQPPVQQVQVIPTPPPPEEKAEQEEAKKEESEVEEEEEVDKKLEVVPEEEGGVVEKQIYDVKERPQPLERRAVLRRAAGVKYDIVTLFNLMGWVKDMLDKYSVYSLWLMLEIFEDAGYISGDLKEFVKKIADLLTFNEEYRDVVWELYRLYRLINPEDTTMDSQLLSLKLDKKL